jgi:hypothetical protein
MVEEDGASELFAIDIRTLEGLASLIANLRSRIASRADCWGSTKRGGGKEGCRSQGSRAEEKKR